MSSVVHEYPLQSTSESGAVSGATRSGERMTRARNKLSARKVATLSDTGRHGDGGGLYLVIDTTGETYRRRWLYLFTLNGKRREMGLGGFPEVSLADARKARDVAEQSVRGGVDPIDAREASKRASEGKQITSVKLVEILGRSPCLLRLRFSGLAWVVRRVRSWSPGSCSDAAIATRRFVRAGSRQRGA